MDPRLHLHGSRHTANQFSQPDQYELNAIRNLQFPSPQGKITQMVWLLNPDKKDILSNNSDAADFNKRFWTFVDSFHLLNIDRQIACDILAEDVFGPMGGDYLEAYYSARNANDVEALTDWLRANQKFIQRGYIAPKLQSAAGRGNALSAQGGRKSIPPVVSSAPHFRTPSSWQQASDPAVSMATASSTGRQSYAVNSPSISSATQSKVSDHEALVSPAGIGSFNVSGGRYRDVIPGQGKLPNNGYNEKETTDAYYQRLENLGKHVAEHSRANDLGLWGFQEVPIWSDKNVPGTQTAEYLAFENGLKGNLDPQWEVNKDLQTFTRGTRTAMQIAYRRDRLELLMEPKQFGGANKGKYGLDKLGDQDGRVQFSLFKDKRTQKHILVANVHAAYVESNETSSKLVIMEAAEKMAKMSELGFPELIILGDFNVENSKLLEDCEEIKQNPMLTATDARNISYDPDTGGQKEEHVDLIMSGANVNLTT